jgi:hypothetical protein
MPLEIASTEEDDLGMKELKSREEQCRVSWAQGHTPFNSSEKDLEKKVPAIFSNLFLNIHLNL